MRIRIHFAKTEAMRYTGHLDLFKTWERTFRRSGLPLSYSQGFHPQPRLNLACALPLGFTSQDEFLDAWLDNPIPPAEILSALIQAVPPGIDIEDAQEVDPREPALQTQITAAEYEIVLLEPASGLEQKLSELLAAESLLRQRRDRVYDLRPLIEAVQRLPDTLEGFARMKVCLSAREAATGRPEELVSALGYNPAKARIHRLCLKFMV
jgi:radical SAM-linked protein